MEEDIKWGENYVFFRDIFLPSINETDIKQICLLLRQKNMV
jgi:hypothetical protein